MKYKNNKEHPIDNLFAQKLGNLEGTPSENAWQALEKGLSQKPRKKNKAILWLPYAAAATIALLLVSVWLLRQQITGSLTNTGIANNQVESRQEQNPSTITTDSSAAKDETTQQPTDKALEEQIAMQENKDRNKERGKENVGKNTEKTKQVTAKTLEKQPATPPTVKETTQEKASKPVIDALENTVAQMEKEPAVITPASFVKDESTTIVVTVNLEEDPEASGEEEEILAGQTEEVQRKTKAGKIFSTLKKIKKGDFDELGIRPETIVAYVKDKASNNQSNEK